MVRTGLELVLTKWYILGYLGDRLKVLAHHQRGKMTLPKTQPESIAAYIDPSISPTEDFYAHVNKRWCDANPIPPDKARWGSFNVLRHEVNEQVRALLEEIAENDVLPHGSNGQKIRDLYRAGMNEEQIENDGIETPMIQHEIHGIEAMQSVSDIIEMVGKLHFLGVAPLWAVFVKPDARHSTTDRLHVEQAGLSLPDRDYYLKKDDEKFAKVRAEFIAYMEAMHCLLGDTPEEARKNADAVYAIEERLARVSLPAVERRDEGKQYHTRTLRQFAEREGGLGHVWNAYLKSIEVLPAHTPEYMIVRQPPFLEECENVILGAVGDSAAFKALQSYLRWHFINGVAGMLPRAFADLHFGFYGKTLTGAEAQKPRWERVLGVVGAVLGEALGELYVSRHFPPEARQRIGELVDDLHAVYADRIKKLPWMGEETKKRALAKLATFKKKLGHPEKWRDYSALHIAHGAPYVDMYLHGNMTEFARMMQKIDQPVDRAEWYMTPQTVNAYCDQQMNEIVFPAGILQPPFFDHTADDAVNYGGIGTVIGHELTHGFDDQGSKFDEEGNLSGWWTDEDGKQFTQRADILVRQFNACRVHGLSVNGALTLGENIADLGSVVIAYEALQRVLARKGGQEKIDGFTPEQRFFLSYARLERENVREELARQYLTMDPHSPGHLRINIPLSNLPEFYEAFGCEEGCAMYRPESDRAEIW